MTALKKSTIRRSGSLKELGFWPGKILAGMKATVKTSSAAAGNLCAWLCPITDFLDNIRAGQPDTCSPTTIRLAESLNRQACQHAVSLLAKIFKVKTCKEKQGPQIRC